MVSTPSSGLSAHPAAAPIQTLPLKPLVTGPQGKLPHDVTTPTACFQRGSQESGSSEEAQPDLCSAGKMASSEIGTKELRSLVTDSPPLFYTHGTLKGIWHLTPGTWSQNSGSAWWHLTWVAVKTMMCWTSRQVRQGRTCSMRAIMPAARGAAAEVPVWPSVQPVPF